jgi:hypothetical protein
VEIKGLIAVCRSELVPFAPYVELWCKWRLQASALEMTKRTIIQKTRWIRTYDTSRAAIVEIPLQADEKPLNGQPLPQQGCNVEISKIQIAEDPRQWWTLGFEAFGDLDSAPRNLLKTAQFLITLSFPLPICGEFLNYPSWLAQTKSFTPSPYSQGHTSHVHDLCCRCCEEKRNKSGVERVKAPIMERLAHESARTNAIIYGTWRASADVHATPYPAR